MAETQWLDRLIDALRSRSMLFLMLGLAAGWLLFAPSTPEYRIYLALENADEIVIDSIQMEFGFDVNQSNLVTVQLRPGETRHLVLNHPPGRGFNVEARYSDGQVQSFCANRNIKGHHQSLVLQR